MELATLVAVLLGLAGLAAMWFRMGRWTQHVEDKLERVDGRLQRMEARLEGLYSWADGFARELNSFFGIVVQGLARRQALSPEEVRAVTQGLSNLNAPAASELLEWERRWPLVALGAFLAGIWVARRQE